MKPEKTIKFAAICDGTVIPEWQARCLQRLIATDGVRLALLITSTDAAPTTTQSVTFTSVLLGRHPLWDWYCTRFVTARSAAMKPVDLTHELSDVPRLKYQAARSQEGGNRLATTNIESLYKHDLDFILQFSPEIFDGDVVKAPRYGVWVFCHGDVDKHYGGPPCFWEIYLRDSVTGAALLRLSERADSGTVLYKGFFDTIDDSYVHNQVQAYFGINDWPPRVCRDIQNGVANYVNSAPDQSHALTARRPNNLQMFRFLLTLFWNRCRNAFQWRFLKEQWHIGTVDRPIHTFRNSQTAGDVRWLPTLNRDRYFADPFGIRAGDSITIMAEEFDYRSQRGRISTLITNGHTIEKEAEPVIELEYHMSYPYLFEHNGHRYCVPEVHQSGEVSLFRADRFPYTWRKVATILRDFAAVDSTLFEYNDRWWLFCTNQEFGANTKLYAWHAPSLFGPWEPHSANPLKTDICSSRPAGTPFVFRGELYRPAQDCSRTYGGAITMNRVSTLSTTEFAEEMVAVIKPDSNGPFRHGLHTLSSVGDLTLIDGKRYIFVLDYFWRAIETKFRSAFNRP